MTASHDHVDLDVVDDSIAMCSEYGVDMSFSRLLRMYPKVEVCYEVPSK